MEKFRLLEKIKEVYAQNGNMMQYLRSVDERDANTIEDILISYDFQSGSYVRGVAKNLSFKEQYCGAIAAIIDSLGDHSSLLEVGVGEATTLNPILHKLQQKPAQVFGFDISWSRLKFAKDFLKETAPCDVQLFTGNLFETPLPDNSIDVVYTSHSIEPNGGKEREALEELYRITKNYLVLLEPCYELADEEARARMLEHGYITNLHATAQQLGYHVIEYRLFDYSANPSNPTGLMIIEKNRDEHNEPLLSCPIWGTKLEPHSPSLLYSKDSCLAYPVIEDIPCLLKENAILATHLLTDYQEFKKEHGIKFDHPLFR